MMTAGSTTTCKNKYIVEDDCTLDTEVETDISSEEGSAHSEASVDNDSLSDWEETIAGHIDIDAFMTSAAHARKSKSIDAEHLSKIWRILLEDAERTIDVTSQHAPRTGNPHLSRNY